DARRVAGIRRTSLHRATASGAANGNQHVSAAVRHSARVVADVSERAPRSRPVDGRGAARARGGAMHFTRAADAAGRHSPRGARPQGAYCRAVVLGCISAASSDRWIVVAATATAADNPGLGGRRNDAARTQDVAGRRADSRSLRVGQRAAELAVALDAARMTGGAGS